MIDDPIVSEVRRARREILESYNWDFREMMRDMMKRQWQSGHQVVSPKKERKEQGPTNDSVPG